VSESQNSRLLQQRPHSPFPRPLDNQISAPLHQPLLSSMKLPIVQPHVTRLVRRDEGRVDGAQSLRLAEGLLAREDATEE